MNGAGGNGMDQDRAALSIRLTRRLLAFLLPMTALLTLARLDRGPALAVPSLALMALFAAGFPLLRRGVRVQNAYMAALMALLSVVEIYWGLQWGRGNLPPVLVLLGVNGLLFHLAWNERLGRWAFAVSVGGITAVGLARQPLAWPVNEMATDLALAALGLQATAWAYERVQAQLWDESRRQLRRLTDERAVRDRLVGAMLDNLELPVTWADLEHGDPALQAAGLRQGLEEARRLRAGLEDAPVGGLDLGASRRLLLPLLGVGVAIAACVGARDLAVRDPNAWIGVALTAVLGACTAFLKRVPRAWNAVAGTTLLAAAAAIALGAWVTAPGSLPAGLAFASMTITFAAFWLGLRSAVLFTAGMLAITAWVAFGRGVPLDDSGRTVAGNMVAVWILLAYFLAPAARAQQALLERLEQQSRQLGAQLRVRRRLLGTLFHDAANHVATLSALAALRQGGQAQPGDAERFNRIHRRLAGLVGAARGWLFNDEPFAPERLERVDVDGLGRAMEELFREALRAKSLELRMDLPRGLAVAAVPELVGDAVVGNLLSNAIRYSRPGQRISVRAWQQEGWTCVAVQDQGPGIPAEGLAAHERGETLPRRPGSGGETGQGLGLALAREHLGRMGGRLELRAAPGGGLEARLWLRTA